MVEFTFGQVETVLMSYHRIAEHKRVALTGRLKFLQKNGVPMRDAPGRGKTGSYTWEHLVQMALALELLQAGLTPLRAARIVKQNWIYLLDEVFSLQVSVERSSREKGVTPTIIAPWVWFIGVEELNDLRDEEDSEPWYLRTVESVNLEKWKRGKGKNLGFTLKYPRGVVIDAGFFISVLMQHTVDRLKFATVKELVSSFEGLESNLRATANQFAFAIYEEDESLKWYLAETGTRPITLDKAKKATLKAEINRLNTSGIPSEWSLRGAARLATYAVGKNGREEFAALLRQGLKRDEGAVVEPADLAANALLQEFQILEKDGEHVKMTPVGQRFFDLITID